MKKVLIVLFSVLLTALFLIPASAANQSESIEAKYKSLREISNDLAKESRIGSAEFRELSEDAIEYLQGFDIDTDSVGEIYYEVDPDGILVLRALSLMSDDSIRITTVTSYGQDKDGNYRRFDNIDLINQISSISWQYKDYYNYEDYNSTIRLYADLYTYQGTISISGGTHTCLRPYQSSFKYKYLNTNYHPSITNYLGSIQVTGTLRHQDGSYITSNFVWATAYNLPAPVELTVYNRYNYLDSDEILDISGYSNPKNDCSFYIAGAYNSTVFYLY